MLCVCWGGEGKLITSTVPDITISALEGDYEERLVERCCTRERVESTKSGKKHIKINAVTH